MADNYDVLIVGAGVAGMTAGMYAARYGLRTGIVERMMGGASIINIEKIENFPGFPEGISGAELGPAVQEQAMNAGADFIMGDTSKIAKDGDYRVVSSDAGTLRAKAVIIAAGSTLRQLGIPGEEEFFGRGVSQCATCDGPLYMNQVVAVVGGGDSAADEALTLTEYAERVLLIHRRDQLRAQQALIDRVGGHSKIEVVWNTVIEEVLGSDTVSGLRLRNTVTNLENAIELSGLFVYVGLEPNSGLVDGLLKTDNAGHIPVNVSMETDVPGVYAVGDLRQKSSSQLVSAAGDGATAAIAAYKYISSRSWN
ncbi:MAG: thioredoxin-disulfide reductase [Chloroflexi bacterium]|nr:thioredoxin-disulfide reductase [Chloroflexota bacterium]MCH8988556.1 thioredoxin-disulfide reductase [Chloroflexota bacterium]